jgi:DNA-binding CsgD family transcriptional regulator
MVASWSPHTDTHRVLARYGYDESTAASLEMRDAEAWQSAGSPAGFEDTISVDMVAADGQYVGLIAFSAVRRGAIGDESRVILSSLAAAVAPAFDLRSHRRLTAVVSDDWRATVVDRRGGNWPVADASHCWSVVTGALDGSLAAFLAAPPSTGTKGLVVIEEKCLEIKLEAVADPLSPGEIAALVSERNSELPYGLSVREFDILNALAHGHSNDRIAIDRVISVRTVTSHVGRILRKMGCSSRAAAALRAVRDGRLQLAVDLPVSE